MLGTSTGERTRVFYSQYSCEKEHRGGLAGAEEGPSNEDALHLRKDFAYFRRACPLSTLKGEAAKGYRGAGSAGDLTI